MEFPCLDAMEESGPEPSPASRLGFAFLLACPGCFAAVLMGLAASYGASIMAIRGVVAGGAAIVLLAMWIRNIRDDRTPDQAAIPNGLSTPC